MKATSRKRLLISSVAMLLVAMLALGTATFAWFTTAANVKASKINVKTTKSSHLELSKANMQWSASGITYQGDTVKDLKPASSDDGVNWYYGNAAASTASPIPQTAGSVYNKLDDSNVASDGDYVFTEMLNIRNAGETKITGITITVAAVGMSPLARIAIVPVTDMADDDTAMPAVPTADEYAAFTGNIYSNDVIDAGWDAVAGTGATVAYNADKTDMPATKAANGATISVPDLDPDGGTGDGRASYRLFVWFDGEDGNLYDTTSSSLTVPNITFTVAGTPT